MATEHKTIQSIQELVGHILGLRSSLPERSFLWFRGLTCSSYELLPKIMRDTRPIDQVLERELRLLTRFKQRSMAYWPAGYEQNDWEHLFAMQHYGLPTCLLDWSENLFVAAYFALAPTSVPHTHDGSCSPAIWCINPVKWNRSMPGLSEFGDTVHVLTTADEEVEAYRPITNRKRSKSPVAIYGTHNSQRIVAQRGTFMVWGNESTPLETIANDASSAILLWRFDICGDRSTLFDELQTLGFTETMVFPEMSFLATELCRLEGWRS